MVNGRKKIGWQQGDGNVLQKGMEMHDKNPVCYRGSYTAFMFQPLCCSNPLGDACDLTFSRVPHNLSLSPAFLRFILHGFQFVVRGSRQVLPHMPTAQFLNLSLIIGAALLAILANEQSWFLMRGYIGIYI
jgi:hypothetical protein